MNLLKLLSKRQRAIEQSAEDRSEFAVYIKIDENKSEWGNGLTRRLEISARPIVAGSDFDDFWPEGKSETNLINEGGSISVRRYRLLARSNEEAISLGFATFLNPSGAERESSSKKEIVPTKEIGCRG